MKQDTGDFTLCLYIKGQKSVFHKYFEWFAGLHLKKHTLKHLKLSITMLQQFESSAETTKGICIQLLGALYIF